MKKDKLEGQGTEPGSEKSEKEKGPKGPTAIDIQWWLKAGATSVAAGAPVAIATGIASFVPEASTALTKAASAAVTDLAFSLFIGSSILAAWGVTSLLINKFKPDTLPEKVGDLNKWVIPTAAACATVGVHCLVNSFNTAAAAKHIVDATTEQVIGGISLVALAALGVVTYFLYFKAPGQENDVPVPGK